MFFLGRATDPDDAGNDRLFVENDAAQVIKILDSGAPVKFFFIRLQDNATTLQPVTLKGGARAAGRVFEIAEIEAGGAVVGSAEIPT